MRERLNIGLLAATTYVPLLLTSPGIVGADTKTYLFLDPGRLLRDSLSMWDSGIGAGTVTHQNIGYLWPMGPWFWIFERAGAPDWVAQRLWLATVMFAAGMGVRWLLRTIGWSGTTGGLTVAMLAYSLSPYLLHYSSRISVILLPWAGLPWLIGLMDRALRNRGWRHPALFALVTVTIGGINATALLMIAFAPALWVLQVWASEKGIDARRVIVTLAKVGLLTLSTSLWWIAGLWAQGRFGLPVIRFTESYRTVSEASTGPEVLRGLGYWFFYGRDKLGPWIEPSVDYTNRTLLLTLSFGLPICALIAAAFIKWRYRTFFVVIIAVGGFVAVGAHPWNGPSLAGAVFKAFTRSDWGLSLRSTPRAIPQVILGTSVLLGAGVSAVGSRLPRYSAPLSGLACLLVAANLPTLWTGEMVAENLQRPEDLPEYWDEVTSYLDERDYGTRVLELPGSDFASYRWGNTVDPVTPGLMDRPYVARELFAYGSPTSMGLLDALDRRLQEDVLEPESIAPIARLFGVGEILFRADLQYERYRTPRPRPTWRYLQNTPGLSEPVAFGDIAPNVAGPEFPLIDETELALDQSLPYPPPVSLFEIEDPTPIVRTRPISSPVVLSGGPDGLVTAAAAGILDSSSGAVFYASALEEDAELDQILERDAWLVVTDTNRKQGRRWGTIRETMGRTEMEGERPVVFDPTDNRLETFPGSDDSDRTVSIQDGPATVWASGYGNFITFTTDDRPSQAMDGDPFTAWRVAAMDDPVGEFIQVDLDSTRQLDHITLLQPTFGIANRSIREVRITFDSSDDSALEVVLDESSMEMPGQRIEFEERAVSTVRIEITATDIGPQHRYDGMSGVGFAEIGIDDITIEEQIRPPTSLLDRVAEEAEDHHLSFVFSRMRSNSAEPVRTDEEQSIVRQIEVPNDRIFQVSGRARLSSYALDKTLDSVLGMDLMRQGGVDASSSLRLPGAIAARASATIDGDPSTWWSPAFQSEQPDLLDFFLAEPMPMDHLTLSIITDGRHSVPSRISIRIDGYPVATREIAPGELPLTGGGDSQTGLRIDFEPTTGSRITVSIDEISQKKTIDWYSEGPITLPIAISEITTPGLHQPAPEGLLDTGCRDDLLTIDDRPVWMRVTGTVEDAEARHGLDVRTCGESLNGVLLESGTVVLRGALGRLTGIDIDWLLLDSEVEVGADDGSQPIRSEEGPPVRIDWQRKTRGVATVTDATEPFWLILGQSYSEGWSASVDGVGLGAPTLVDGFANGWQIEPTERGSTVIVDLEWRPQRKVDLALALSGIGIVVCLILALRPGPDPVLGRAKKPVIIAWGRRVKASSRRSVLLAGASATLMGVALTPFPSIASLVPALVLLLVATGRVPPRLPSLLAGTCLIIAGGFTTLSQDRNSWYADFSWPHEFEVVHIFGVLCLTLLLTQGIADFLLRDSDR